jgi:hypothetical protein
VLTVDDLAFCRVLERGYDTTIFGNGRPIVASNFSHEHRESRKDNVQSKFKALARSLLLWRATKTRGRVQIGVEIMSLRILGADGGKNIAEGCGSPVQIG